jgi:cell wall-associated NlpC family hydrolase
MSTRSAARQEVESHPVPSLEIVPRLGPVADGDGASLPTPPSITVRGGLGLRHGLIALLAAVAVAAAVFLITHRTHQLGGRAAAVPTTHQREKTSSRLALTGVHAASSAMLSAAAAQSGHTITPSQTTPVPHDLSGSDLTSLAAGTSLYEPARYLANAYRTVAAQFHVPWRVLAALQYLQGDYVNAIAGASAGAERTVSDQVQSNGRDAVDEHVLAQATAAALQPSASLLGDARKLGADTTGDGPAAALATYLKPVATTPQTVMTLAQSIAPAATSSSAGPMAKVSAMLNEARLLNGLPYSWGGGHTNPAWVVSSGYDCSGFVSEVLHSAGYLNSPDTTQTLPGSAGILNGPGKLVTIYDRTIATVRVWRKHKKIVTEKKIVNQTSAGVHVVKGRHSNSLNSVSIKLPKWVGEWETIKIKKLVRSQDTTNNDEHVIIDIDGQWWESGGSTADGGAARVHQIVDPGTAYLKSFNRILHPQGL